MIHMKYGKSDFGNKRNVNINLINHVDGLNSLDQVALYWYEDEQNTIEVVSLVHLFQIHQLGCNI